MTMSTAIAAELYDWPRLEGLALEREPAFDDPTQGRTVGMHPYDDPTQGRKLGSDRYDDPTRGRR